MNKLWYFVGLIIILYFLKVPSVVHFIDGILSVVITSWNYMLDVLMHVKDRHPWIWISLPLWLIILMKKD